MPVINKAPAHFSPCFLWLVEGGRRGARSVKATAVIDRNRRIICSLFPVRVTVCASERAGERAGRQAGERHFQFRSLFFFFLSRCCYFGGGGGRARKVPCFLCVYAFLVGGRRFSLIIIITFGTFLFLSLPHRRGTSHSSRFCIMTLVPVRNVCFYFGCDG